MTWPFRVKDEPKILRPLAKLTVNTIHTTISVYRHLHKSPVYTWLDFYKWYWCRKSPEYMIQDYSRSWMVSVKRSDIKWIKLEVIVE